jgi:hypothetical protein
MIGNHGGNSMQSPDAGPRRWLRRLCIVAICVLTVAGVGIWFCFAVRDAREMARACWCNNKFKQIALSMHIYEHRYGSLPPAHWPDQNGRPMHSWRVLMLPVLEGDEAFRRYRLDEPWNSQHNSTLAPWTIDPEHPELGPEYRCPCDVRAGKYDSSRLAFVGPHAAFNGSHPRKPKEFTDGLSNTAVLGEMSESGIHWMEPRDFNVEEMSFRINDRGGISVRSDHPHGAMIALGDGSVRFLSDDTDPKLLKALTTIDGKEAVSAPSD